MTNRHLCTKCSTPYYSDDEDAYLCEVHSEEKRAIAAKIDAQFAGRSNTSVRTALQEYDEAPKVHGFMRA